MTGDEALDILQSALDRCRVEDIRTPELYGALTFLEKQSGVKWPFNQFRAALESARTMTLERESLWQVLNAAMNGIHRNVDGLKLEG